jgi:hypothetical protein
MQNFRVFTGYPHGDYVNSVLDPGSSMPGHPDQRGTAQLLELTEVHRARWAAKAEVASRLYFDKRDRFSTLDYEVQVSVPVPEPVLKNAPAMTSQPSGRDAFTEETESLGIREHAAS